ncbi:hypothetical protein ElyMa_004075000 [Elysia marginata]|uniref:Uncharacterized protein n=1 Tax=Elysia marginata TaxID=1093978 RepID=A0AAV4G9A7_9GAST|nr:hypothetical protein ElyMa_004075000 [Elysia marginata]
MECLVDDTANCNLPMMSPRCSSDVSGSGSLQFQPQASPTTACVCPVTNDRINISPTTCSEDNRLANTNNNVTSYSPADHGLDLSFHCDPDNNSSPTSATRPVAVSSISSNLTKTTYAGHRPRSSHSCSCSNQRPNPETAENRPRSHSSPLGTQSNQCRHCVSLSNTGGRYASATPGYRHGPVDRGGGGERLSLESYLIPDPQARVELELRLRAYSRAAGQEHSTDHDTDGSDHADMYGCFSAPGYSPSPSSSHCTRQSQQFIPLNLNLCQDDYDCHRLDNSLSNEGVTDTKSSPAVPSFLVTNVSGDQSVLNLSEATGLSSPTNPVRDASNSFCVCDSDAANFSSDYGFKGSESLAHHKASSVEQAVLKTSPHNSANSGSRRTPGVHPVGRHRESPLPQGATPGRRNNAKGSQGLWSRHEMLAQLHCQPVEDSEREEFEDTLTDDVISSLGFHNYSIHEILGK